jgi:hypothetical protein
MRLGVFGDKKVFMDFLLVITIYDIGYKINIKAIPIFHSIFFPVYEYMKDYCKSRNFTKS